MGVLGAELRVSSNSRATGVATGKYLGGNGEMASVFHDQGLCTWKLLSKYLWNE